MWYHLPSISDLSRLLFGILYIIYDKVLSYFEENFAMEEGNMSMKFDSDSFSLCII